MDMLRSVSGALLRAGVTLVDRRRQPRVNGTLELPDLNGPVEVLRDRWGIPHLYAQNDHDLYLAQGFVHAQDRLWQMELLRRLSSGRLSELFGELSLDTDRATRTFGFARLGQADWDRATSAPTEAITAYSQGVNAYLSSGSFARERPVEFSMLKHQPETWRPEDTLTIARLLLWQLSHAWYSEIVRAQVVQAVGPERAAEIDVYFPAELPLVLPRGIEFNRLVGEGILQAAQGPYLSRGLGSNAWAISGARTDTGHPVLCNDMHLSLTTPGLWYLVHQEAGALRVSGASLPGAPFVLVGHNAHIAWGMTLALTDCEDLFVERFEPGTARYAFRGELREAQVITEEIGVKGRAEPYRERVLMTHHGPVISDVVGRPEERLAVQSMALRPSCALDGWWQLDRATGWDEFVDAVACIGETQLSVTYADTEGNTGYWVTGAVPVRASGHGMVPAEGWTGDAEWVGEVPFEEMPHALNPSDGFLVNCNQRIVDESYPHFLGNAWVNGYRARRVRDVIAGKVPFSLADCRALQMDLITTASGELVRRLSDFDPVEPDLRDALERLRAWDGNLTADSAAGAIYEVLRMTLARNV
ncbi:MAG: penicillin acylase family protein, partial [Anaerolineae bacterium]